MAKYQTTTFQLYRYQILPITQAVQLSYLNQDITSVDELNERKNEIFLEVLTNIKEFTHHRSEELVHKLHIIDGLIVLHLGVRRSLVRLTKEFQEEELDNWPSIYLIINNDPDVQMIATEVDPKAFSRQDTLINMLEKNLNERLVNYLLSVEIFPLFDQRKFWDIVKTHKNRVTSVDFLMVAPNLANISGSLNLDLGELKRRTNSLKTNLGMNSPEGESLTLSQEDEFVKGLVDYTSEGGGTVHLRIRGISKIIKTEDSVKSIEIDDIHIIGDDAPEQLGKVLRDVLK